MQKFMRKPSIDMFAGIKVTGDTELQFENDNIQQTVSNLTLHTIMTVQGEGYRSTYDTVIDLQEGDVLVFEGEGRGYIKPVEEFMTVAEVIEELKCIKDL